jgi:hypothetical protein
VCLLPTLPVRTIAYYSATPHFASYILHARVGMHAAGHPPIMGMHDVCRNHTTPGQCLHAVLECIQYVTLVVGMHDVCRNRKALGKCLHAALECMQHVTPVVGMHDVRRNHTTLGKCLHMLCGSQTNQQSKHTCLQLDQLVINKKEILHVYQPTLESKSLGDQAFSHLMWPCVARVSDTSTRPPARSSSQSHYTLVLSSTSN